MQLWSTDTGNACLEARTKEKLVIVAGGEFGPLEGHSLAAEKALCGLCTSGLRWHERFADCMHEMNFLCIGDRTEILDVPWR